MEPVLTDLPVWLMFLSSLPLYVLFVIWEKRVASLLLDIRLFSNQRSGPLGSAACNQFAYKGAFVVIPSVSGPYGYSVGAAALLMVLALVSKERRR